MAWRKAGIGLIASTLAAGCASISYDQLGHDVGRGGQVRGQRVGAFDDSSQDDVLEMIGASNRDSESRQRPSGTA